MKNKLLLIAFVFFTMAAYAQPRQGMQALEIHLPSISGDSLKLSSLKGKVVLLDFWASWCPPCRLGNRNLAKLYPKFRDKGFEILGVSLDSEPAAWLKAIKQDKVSWLQVNDPHGWDSKTAAAWQIYALPTSYLIDREGRLIAMDLEGKQLEKALKELIDK